MEPAKQFLADLKVLVTRPKELANNLALLIEQAGGIPILYPVISIEEPKNTELRDRALKQLSSFDIAVFISPTAVRKTLEHVDRFPSTLRIAALGSSTANSLKQNNILVSIQPDGHDSESLLKHSELQPDKIAGKSIVIFRGEGGRNMLGNTLMSRGSHVHYAEMYRRARAKNRPPLSVEQLNNIDIITVTSNEGLQNLFELSANKQALLKLPLIVPGERCERLAKELGFHVVVKSSDARDISCIETLRNWATILRKTTSH
jgi:uroporphyrinogen-III synthase